MIYIIGLGPNNSSNIKENIKNLLLNNTSAKIIARTKEHPAISFLESNNIPFETCDRFYTENENFENTYNSITNYILEQANSQDVLNWLLNYLLKVAKILKSSVERAS